MSDFEAVFLGSCKMSQVACSRTTPAVMSDQEQNDLSINRLRVVFPDKQVIISNPYFHDFGGSRTYTDSFTNLFTTVPQMMSMNLGNFFSTRY